MTTAVELTNINRHRHARILTILSNGLQKTNDLARFSLYLNEQNKTRV